VEKTAIFDAMPLKIAGESCHIAGKIKKKARLRNSSQARLVK